MYGVELPDYMLQCPIVPAHAKLAINIRIASIINATIILFLVADIVPSFQVISSWARNSYTNPIPLQIGIAFSAM